MNEIQKIELPNYTQEDYLHTQKPYEFLHEFYLADKFLFNQAFQIMKKNAQMMKATGFADIWKAFLQANSDKIPENNYLVFDGQEYEFKSGKYFLAEDKSRILTFDKFGFEVEVCRHPIIPIERFTNIDTNEERIKLAYKTGFKWRDLLVERTTIASNKIVDLSAYGVFVNHDNMKALSSFLLDIEHLNYNDIPEIRSVGRLGWVKDGEFAPYVDGLKFDGEQSFKNVFEAVKQQGSFEDWKQAMLKIRENGTTARIYLASAFASALVKPLKVLPFFVHLWGGTENGKTVALMIAASVWADPKTTGGYITTFNSTAVAQELQAGFLNSLPMCIDELQIQSSQGVKDFDKIIYQLTEGVGKSRGAKTGGLQKHQSWANCILTNGEHPISNSKSGGGAVNRVIEFECTEKIYSDLPWLCDVVTQNYGFAGKMFVEYLQSESGVSRAKEIQKDFYNQLLKTESTEKQASSASVILTADYLVNELIFQDDNVLTISDLEEVMAKKTQVDVNLRAYNFIFDLVASNERHFKSDSFEDYKHERWGTIDDNHIFIIKSVFDRLMKENGFNAESFLSWAKRKQKIECEERRYTKRKVLPHSKIKTPCICLIIPNNMKDTELNDWFDENDSSFEKNRL